MTFEKWEQCVYPNLMLRYLRGDVPESERAKGGFGGGWSGGTIYGGASPHAAREECAELGRRVSLLWSIIENQQGEELKDMWGRKAADLNDLYETAWFLDCAAVGAYTLAAGSMAFTCAAVTEEEKWYWGWGCGPDDPLWDAAKEALRVLHACLIREVFIYPDIPMPDTD
ncbi:MAG: hypothetical protein JWM59_2280 [Verrucomicrobiales bacterium]|nr:hypothetical protein [Verrucomicrobiales bacterium]